jgi:hypothetical protein
MNTSVARALLYLRLTSTRNGLRSRLMRLRQPKYLVGGIIGVAYLYFFFVRPVSSPRGTLPSAAEFASTLELGGAAAVFAFAMLSWILPSAPTGLAFTEAEIAMLFPAPMRSRTLIHYRLLSSQFALLFSALIFGIVSARWNFTGNFFMRTIAWWVVLATLNLHSTGASFAIARLLKRGVTAWPRRLLVGAVVVTLVSACWFLSARDIDILDLGVRQYLAIAMQWPLAIPKLVVAPFLARDVVAYLWALVPAMLVLLAHYAWVLYTATEFEEASIASAQKRAMRLAAFRSGRSIAASAPAKRRSEPFSLRGPGRPEIAIFWKNLLAGSTFFRPKRLAIAAILVFAGCRWLTSDPAFAPFVAAAFTLSLMVVIMTAFLGPHVARNDLRGDLPNADLLKTYPLQGWQIASGQLLAPAFALTSVLWLALLAAAITMPEGRISVPGTTRTSLAIGLAVLAPAWCAIQLIVMNALSLLFPAWVQIGRNRGEHGFDVLGQRILFMAAQLLVVLVAFIPASLVAGVVLFVVRAIAGPEAGAIAASVAVVAVLAAEIAIGVIVLGAIFERFDMSRELRS